MNEGKRSIRLVAGGDIMLGEHPIMVGRGMLTQMMRNRTFSPFSHITSILQEADLAFGNLECVLSDPPRDGVSDERECRGPSHGIECLMAAGFSALSIANNHSRQHGKDALNSTVAALKMAGIAPVGQAVDIPGRCEPVDLEIKGLGVRLLGYSLRPRQNFSERPEYAEGTLDGVISDVREGKKLGYIVIVSLHWGDEFMKYPSEDQVAFGRAVIDAGATLLLGHHPHVLQGAERYGGGIIVYSLGNLVFDMPWMPELRRTALFSCDLSHEGVGQFEWLPMQLNKSHCPQPASRQVSVEIQDFLQDAAVGLEKGSGPWAIQGRDQYQEDLGIQAAKQRKASHLHLLANIGGYEFNVLRSIIGKFIKRRIGILKD